MNKIKLLSIAAAGLLGLASCSFTDSLTNSSSGVGEEITLASLPVKQYALAASNAVMYLGASSNSTVKSALKMAAADVSSETTTSETTSSTETTEDTTEVSTVEKYYSIYKSLTTEGAVSVKTYESTREGYSYVAEVTANSVLGEASTYYLFWNEAEVKDTDLDDDDNEDIDEGRTDTTVTSEPGTGETGNTGDSGGEASTGGTVKGKNGGHEDEEDDEKITKLDGLLVVGELEYTVKGINIADETEGDNLLLFHASLETGERIKVTAHTENDETAFSYRLYDAERKLVEKNVVKMEVEDSETEIKMSTLKDGVKSRYVFESKTDTENGNKLVFVSYDTGSERGFVMIFVSTDADGNETIVYSFNGTDNYESDGEGHYDHDDEGHHGHDDEHGWH